VVYPKEKAEAALRSFFKESTLVALREMALREAAHQVNVRYVDMDARLPDMVRPERQRPLTGERILVSIPDHPSAAILIRRARRVADYLGAECFAVHVGPGSDRSEFIERMLNFARNLHIETRIVEGADIAAALVDFARVHGITQIFVERPRYRGLRWFLGKHLIHRIVRLARDMEVIVVAERRPSR
jgi:two-component system sensor histidine kinase KdpD